MAKENVSKKVYEGDIQSRRNVDIKMILEVVRLRATDHQFSVNELAIDLGISMSWLEELVHMKCNCSPSKLIETIRIDEAIQIFASGGAKDLYSVCRCIGYGTTKTLRSAFKRRLGMSPSQCRQSIRSRGKLDELIGALWSGLGDSDAR